MGDAQIGLLIVTPLIIAVGIALRRMGALGSSGLLAVIAMSIAAAAVLLIPVQAAHQNETMSPAVTE